MREYGPVTQIIQQFSEIADRYDVLYCDVWGVLHNGVQVHPGAAAALAAFRAKGGQVVLMTNAPRPAEAVAAHLEELGAPRGCYDLIATSGDAAQDALIAGLVGRKVYHIGDPEKDEPFFHHPDGTPIDVERVALADAEGIVATGLFNDRVETPEDYRLIIARGVNQGLPLLCANPDIVVDKGDKRLFCAGAIAEAYSEAGGKSLYFGKPHPPIYALAARRLAETTGQTVRPEQVLVIGDGLPTDVRGAVGEDLDCLFVTGGLMAEALHDADGQPDPVRLEATLNEAQLPARYAIAMLA